MPGQQTGATAADYKETASPTMIQSTSAESRTTAGDQIQQRLIDTQNWLAKANGDHYSIQLFMARTTDTDKVEAFLRDKPEILDLTKIYIYETVINGRGWYSVLYSDFATQDDAIDKLDALPASLKSSDPYLRRVSALKNDVATR
jgi:septal ring-binding cell division protein DamX